MSLPLCDVEGNVIGTINNGLYEYNVNHDAEWLASVCRRMITSSEIAKHNDYDKGWNKALHSIIDIIEGSMIPPQESRG